MRLMSAMYNYKPAFYGYTIPKRDFAKGFPKRKFWTIKIR